MKLKGKPLPAQSKTSFKTIRIFILLVILLFVGTDAWLTKQRTRDWDHPLWVALYPINGDNSTQSKKVIQGLKEDDFDAIEQFMEREAGRFQLDLQRPITIKLAPEVYDHPPEIPTDGGVPKIILWSLKMRYWAIRSDTFEGPAPNIKIFVVFYDPKKHKTLNHSIGLEKGLLGVANIFADPNQLEQNQFVIAHEILHTVGATDKYDLNSSQPLYPEGYADPMKIPRFPQKRAEIMGGRIPLSETESHIPNRLLEVVIGEKTAREMNWIK